MRTDLTRLLDDTLIDVSNPFGDKGTERDAAKRMHAALVAVMGLHQPHPDGGQGYDAAGNYVDFEQACTACGHADEYAIAWPCATLRAITAALTETKGTTT